VGRLDRHAYGARTAEGGHLTPSRTVGNVERVDTDTGLRPITHIPRTRPDVRLVLVADGSDIPRARLSAQRGSIECEGDGGADSRHIYVRGRWWLLTKDFLPAVGG